MCNIMTDRQGNKIVEVFDNSYDDCIRHIAVNLRADDFDEVFAISGKSPHYDIIDSWQNSLRKWVILNNHGEAVAVLGIRPIGNMFSDIGLPWLVGTDELTKMKKFFVKVSKPIINEMCKHFKLLVNLVDSRYTKAVRWLKWCGFTFEDAKIVDTFYSDVPFHKFYMRSE